MQLAANSCEGWGDGLFSDGYDFQDQDSIATESHPTENPAWKTCIDCLLEAFLRSATVEADDDCSPSRIAVESALSFVARLKDQAPDLPPTCIIPDPNGGLIVERRTKRANGDDFICELAFSNDGTCEATSFLNGKVVQMVEFPLRNVRRELR